jgi:hypothetical protein
MSKLFKECLYCGVPFRARYDSALPARKYHDTRCWAVAQWKPPSSDRFKVEMIRLEIDRLMAGYAYSGNPDLLVRADACLKPLIRLTGWNDL